MADPTSVDNAGTEGDLHSIGRAARIAGLTPAMIRMWERRYGRPQAVRLPSGHRRYTAEQVAWLRRVSEALALGHRAGGVVGASEQELDRLLADGRASDAGDGDTERLLALVATSRGPELTRALDERFEALGPRRFVHDCVAPLVRGIGAAWADGRIDIRHEHLASDRVEDVLRVRRRQLIEQRTAKAHGTLLLLATLPGEPHGLGLQMTAFIAVLEGFDTRVLGTETPEREIVRSAREHSAAGVGLSVSLSSGGAATDRRIADLRDALPRGVRLVVGGGGARGPRRGVRGVRYVKSLAEFEKWLHRLSGDLRRAAEKGTP